ncbi:MAG: protein-disulfide isomerase [Crocinitomicaceae bacterium]|jgi:protein-disulfide isomerase
MGNTSKKRRNKRLWTGGIIVVIALLIISFIVSNSDDPIDPGVFADLEVQEITEHEKGNPESNIRLVEYSDFQCPACKNTAPIISSLIEEFGDQFVFEYRHFPLRSIHPNAQVSAQAAEAAGIQGKFWEMHDMLFDKQAEWGQSFNPERYFRTYAIELGLNEDRFRFDLESDAVKDRVNADYDAGVEAGVKGTPNFILDGESVDLNTFIAEQLDTSAYEESSVIEVVEE